MLLTFSLPEVEVTRYKRSQQGKSYYAIASRINVELLHADMLVPL